MRFKSFTVKNFKGIKECTVSVDRAGVNVFSLVGLNESGKTTILEAISVFVAADKELRKIYELPGQTSATTSYVPKSKKSNFTDTIEISADLYIDTGDVEALRVALLTKGFSLDSSRIPSTIKVVSYFEYVDSDFREAGRRWSTSFYAKPKTGTKYKVINATHPAWSTYVSATELRIPLVCYFPTFLFDFPDRIYLEPHDSETPANAYYRRLFQDILDSLDDDLSVKKHIVDRIRSKDSEWSWFSFLQTDRQEQVNHVMLRASMQVTKVILASWKRVFNKTIDDKRVQIEYGFENDRDAVYIRMSLVDGAEKYDIGNRSLGFRWFFCFWLFTYFRTARRDMNGVVFLLDEPASNLHARAQEELLNNLGSLASDKNIVIYSTHSHYLINPAWLDGTYIITNGNINSGGVEDEFSSSMDTNIKATPYRTFIGKHPNQRNYYLPVLDALEYRPSGITLERPSLLVEGKADFAFFRSTWSNKSPAFSVIPGSGAKSLDPLIGLLTGWGVPFVILLDDDKEGRDAKKMYADRWGLTNNQIKTIKDIDNRFDKASLEASFLSDEAEKLNDHFAINDATKFHVQSYLYEALANGSILPTSDRLSALSNGVWKWASDSLK